MGSRATFEFSKRIKNQYSSLMSFFFLFVFLSKTLTETRTHYFQSPQTIREYRNTTIGTYRSAYTTVDYVYGGRSDNNNNNLISKYSNYVTIFYSGPRIECNARACLASINKSNFSGRPALADLCVHLYRYIAVCVCGCA